MDIWVRYCVYRGFACFSMLAPLGSMRWTSQSGFSTSIPRPSFSCLPTWPEGWPQWTAPPDACPLRFPGNQRAEGCELGFFVSPTPPHSTSSPSTYRDPRPGSSLQGCGLAAADFLIKDHTTAHLLRPKLPLGPGFISLSPSSADLSQSLGASSSLI